MINSLVHGVIIIISLLPLVDQYKVLGVSVDSKFAHYHFAKADRKNGGLGGCAYPLIADITKGISKQYEVLIEDGDDAGLSLRGLFIISDKGILRQKTVNDLPVRSRNA